MVETNIKEALNIARQRYITAKWVRYKEIFLDESEAEYDIIERAGFQIFSMCNVVFNRHPDDME